MLAQHILQAFPVFINLLTLSEWWSLYVFTSGIIIDSGPQASPSPTSINIALKIFCLTPVSLVEDHAGFNMICRSCTWLSVSCWVKGQLMGGVSVSELWCDSLTITCPLPSGCPRSCGMFSERQVSRSQHLFHLHSLFFRLWFYSVLETGHTSN